MERDMPVSNNLALNALPEPLIAEVQSPGLRDTLRFLLRRKQRADVDHNKVRLSQANFSKAFSQDWSAHSRDTF